MSAFLISIGSVIVFFLLVSSLPFVYAGWRRATNRDAELQIWPVMRRLGVSPGAITQGDARMGHVIRRCVMCPSIDACDHWLASENLGSIDEFCPNASVIQDLRRQSQ